MDNSAALRDAKREAFLAELRRTGEVGPSLKKAGIIRGTYKQWRLDDEEFRQACVDAKADAVDDAVLELRTRAVEGLAEPVYANGQPVYLRDAEGEVVLDDDFEPVPFTRRVRSDRLLEVYVKANREEYRDRGTVAVTGEGGGPVVQQLVVTYVLPPGRTMDDYPDLEPTPGLIGEDGLPIVGPDQDG